jgi:hypothetical protein
MNQWKRKKKRKWCARDKKIFMFIFWVIGMPYYQEGHNGTVKSYRSAQTPWKSFYSLSCHISDLPDLSEPHRVPVTCHSTLIRYIRAPSDISDPAESEPIWILHRTYPIEVGYIWCSDTSNGNKFMGARNRPPLPICFGWPLHQLKKLILFTFWAPPSHC